jgi:hypothetical protein
MRLGNARQDRHEEIIEANRQGDRGGQGEGSMVIKKHVKSEEAGDFHGILELAVSVHELHRRMASECAPIVGNLIQRRCRDHQEIEQLLDRLLDCACVPEGLALFKSLCRYYFGINPAATASYVYAYREMWDSEAGTTKDEG